MPATRGLYATEALVIYHLATSLQKSNSNLGLLCDHALIFLCSFSFAQDKLPESWSSKKTSMVDWQKLLQTVSVKYKYLFLPVLLYRMQQLTLFPVAQDKLFQESCVHQGYSAFWLVKYALLQWYIETWIASFPGFPAPEREDVHAARAWYLFSCDHDVIKKFLEPFCMLFNQLWVQHSVCMIFAPW